MVKVPPVSRLVVATEPCDALPGSSGNVDEPRWFKVKLRLNGAVVVGRRAVAVVRAEVDGVGEVAAVDRSGGGGNGGGRRGHGGDDRTGGQRGECPHGDLRWMGGIWTRTASPMGRRGNHGPAGATPGAAVRPAVEAGVRKGHGTGNGSPSSHRFPLQTLPGAEGS